MSSHSYLETQSPYQVSTGQPRDIGYFRTPQLLPGTDLGDSPTPAAQEVLASSYWTGRIIQGMVESAGGQRISLDEYLSNPG